MESTHSPSNACLAVRFTPPAAAAGCTLAAVFTLGGPMTAADGGLVAAINPWRRWRKPNVQLRDRKSAVCAMELSALAWSCRLPPGRCRGALHRTFQS